MLLRQWFNGEDSKLSEMSRKMKEKFDKYWGSIDKMNMTLYYVVILDPRHKLKFIDFSFDTIYDDVAKSEMMKQKVKNGFSELFLDNKFRYERAESSTHYSHPSFSLGFENSQSETNVSSRMYLKDQFKKYKLRGRTEHVKSELEKYLSEDIEDDDEKFDILLWWKVNSLRFPILSKVARDVLAVPVSTVASESTFSTGGRVLDAFRKLTKFGIDSTIIDV
ncbi:zinc finger BED domain-containing protein DAYSLEEPER-like [Henckelia pumila]|uniref:zinc finger BED domain-containing protein DAYSLEEPER-like n=1 Tax=Henckelia pumila TaxID=405737 RepID=UPI003C6DC075